MALSYPSTFPSVGVARMVISGESVVGESSSPFTKESQQYVHAGQCWVAEISMPIMDRAKAEDVVGFLLGLNGKEGYFLYGDPASPAPRGTWAGTPLVNGAHAVGARSVVMDGFTAGATVKRGDWFQSGSGSSARLYKLTQDATADGGGNLTLEIFPRLRDALANNVSLTIAAPKGLWRLAENMSSYALNPANIYDGIVIKCREKL